MSGLSVGAPCGLWISVPTAEYVFYDPDTSRLHAEHIVLHELAHMLSGHATDLDEHGRTSSDPASSDPASRSSGSGPSGSGPSGSGPSGSAPSGSAPSGSGPSGSVPSGIRPSGSGSSDNGIDVSGGALARLVPDLDPHTVQTMLGRVSYTTAQEREAEMLASLIRARAAEPVAPADLPGRTLSRVADVLKFRP